MKCSNPSLHTHKVTYLCMYLCIVENNQTKFWSFQAIHPMSNSAKFGENPLHHFPLILQTGKCLQCLTFAYVHRVEMIIYKCIYMFVCVRTHACMHICKCDMFKRWWLGRLYYEEGISLLCNDCIFYF